LKPLQTPQIHHLGYFAVEEDAARAYDAEARRLRGPATNKVNFATPGQAAAAAAAAGSAWHGAEPEQACGTARVGSQPPSAAGAPAWGWLGLGGEAHVGALR
jgi:hypothetical protein